MTANAPKPNTVPIKKHTAEITPIQPAVQESPDKAKKPFVRKPHLTDRPFQHNEGLQALQKTLQSEQQRRARRSRVNIKSK